MCIVLKSLIISIAPYFFYLNYIFVFNLYPLSLSIHDFNYSQITYKKEEEKRFPDLITNSFGYILKLYNILKSCAVNYVFLGITRHSNF